MPSTGGLGARMLEINRVCFMVTVGLGEKKVALKTLVINGFVRLKSMGLPIGTIGYVKIYPIVFVYILVAMLDTLSRYYS